MTYDELEQAFIHLVETKEYDKILQQLTYKWDGSVDREDVIQFVQDASAEVVRRVKAGGAVTNLAGLIRTIATRNISKYCDELEQARDAHQAMERLAAQGALWRHDEEHQAGLQRAAEYVRGLLPKLDNDSHRRTIAAILDAATEGRQAENKDLAEVLGAKADTVGKWKQRAIDRLAEIVRDEGYGSLGAAIFPPVPDVNEVEDDFDDFEEEERDD